MFFSLTKEIGRLISAKHLLVRRIDIFSERKFEENPVVLKSKKVQDIFGEKRLALSSSAVFRLQNRISNFLKFILLYCCTFQGFIKTTNH